VPEATETTLTGVTLFTRSRAQNQDSFDITISPRGIEIQRPEEEARLLEWDRVATWEIEQRKRDALLVLRGGGSVTPLLIPGWKVNDLDQLLRDMTAHLAQPIKGPDEAPDLELPDADADADEARDAVGAPVLDLEEVLVEEADYSDLDLPDVMSPESLPAPAEEIDLELTPSSPFVSVEPLGEMDLSLPAPTPVADPMAEMDLSLPSAEPAPGAAVKDEETGEAED
jgi:hypothetical protein